MVRGTKHAPGRQVVRVTATVLIGLLAGLILYHRFDALPAPASGASPTEPSYAAAFGVEQLPEGARPFAEKYGPERNSQWSEEWLIRDFYGGKRNGVFVDVGANHYKWYSNTYYLDVELGWSGIAVEPQLRFAADYATHRPRTRFRPFFVSDVSDSLARLYVLNSNPLVTSAERSFTERYGSDSEEVAAPTITLDDLLASEGIERFDFLNMDIELWEPTALAGLSIQRYKPSLVCIEAHPEVTQEILEYFAVSGYVLVAKYLRADEHNLYFTPARHASGNGVPRQ